MSKESRQFHTEGFVVLRDIFPRPQEIRDACNQVLERPSEFACDHANYRIDMLNRDDELRWIAFHPPLLEAMRDVLGKDLAWLPEHSLLRAYYRSVFHRDSNAFQTSIFPDFPTKFRWQEDYQIARPVLYLQDNDPKYGGGLDVIPRSHRGEDREPISVSTKAGDVLLLHHHLWHQATPKKPIRPRSRWGYSCWPAPWTSTPWDMPSS